MGRLVVFSSKVLYGVRFLCDKKLICDFIQLNWSIMQKVPNLRNVNFIWNKHQLLRNPKSCIIVHSIVTVDFLTESKIYPFSFSCSHKFPTAVSKVIHLALCTSPLFINWATVFYLLHLSLSLRSLAFVCFTYASISGRQCFE